MTHMVGRRPEPINYRDTRSIETWRDNIQYMQQRRKSKTWWLHCPVNEFMKYLEGREQELGISWEQKSQQ